MVILGHSFHFLIAHVWIQPFELKGKSNENESHVSGKGNKKPSRLGEGFLNS